MTLDLAVFTPGPAGQPWQQALLPDNSAGDAVSGAQKLAQRFALVLMTGLGTIGYRIARGTSYPNSILGSNLVSELNLFAAFNAGVIQAVQQMQQDDAANVVAPPATDERISTATISGVALSQDTAVLSVVVTSQAGESANLSLPLVLNVP